MFTCTGYGANSATGRLAPFDFQRREPKTDDIEILYCGVCRSDLHQIRIEWQNTVYPCVPGHEIVGRVTRVGAGVEAFKVGQLAGVGCMVDSCRECEAYRGGGGGQENYCRPGFTATYNSPDKHTDPPTFGGYPSHVVADKGLRPAQSGKFGARRRGAAARRRNHDLLVRRRNGLPGVRKSIRFQVAPVPFMVQISGRTAPSVALLVEPVHP